MNERIEELKHLASVWCDENIPEQFSEETLGYGKAWEDKFAELIIRECIQLAQSYPIQNDDYAAGIDSVRDIIKEHFGVE